MKKSSHWRLAFTGLLIIILPFVLPAQTTNPDLQAMVAAERAFAQLARDQNTKDAFLYFLTDDAITSGPSGPIKGKEGIKNQEVNSSWLHWEVAFSDIAGSGDFGYNTGPWEYRANKTDEKAVAFGEFNSIWKKQADGSWRNALDIGVRHGEPASKVAWTTSSLPLNPSKRKSKANPDITSLLEKENELLAWFEKRGNHAFESHLSSESRICRTGLLPIITKQEKQKFFIETNLPTRLHLIGGEVASSNDLGYVYGTAEVQTANKDGQSENKIATYFRVWKKEGKDWKIVLDVLSYQ
jgi:ketosteroid isomerase-like protein